jgi:uncharacterized protein YjbI with pentapeptide repeats
MLIEIKSWINNSVLYSGDFETIKDAVEDAVKNRASLNGASLNGASLNGASLNGAYLNGASLNGASLNRASLDGASLDGASLNGASLNGAYLNRASLNGVSLNGASLNGAYLNGAYLPNNFIYLSISPIGSENGCLWVMKNENGILKYNRGCFSGTETEFRAAILKKHAGTELEKKYLAAIDFIKIQHGG